MENGVVGKGVLDEDLEEKKGLLGLRWDWRQMGFGLLEERGMEVYQRGFGMFVWWDIEGGKDCLKNFPCIYNLRNGNLREN